MSIEKPKDFYNESGQVNDPEDAHLMAREEEKLRNILKPKVERGLIKEIDGKEIIEDRMDAMGEGIQEEKTEAYKWEMEKNIAKKIKEILSKEELEILIDNPRGVTDEIEK